MIAKYLFDIHSGFALLAEFSLSAALLLLSGVFVTQYSKKISDQSGLSRLWIGMMLLAPLSSAGEFISSVTAITFLRAPDIAFGDIFGSNIFNLMILCFLIPVLTYRTPLFSIKGILHERDILLSAWGMILIVISMMGIFLTESIPKSFYFVFSLLIALGYLFGVRMMASYEKLEIEKTFKVHLKTTAMTWIYFLFWGMVMVISGFWITHLSDQIASYPFEMFGGKILLGQTFVGTLFLATVTSLDEAIIAISAIKMSASELAIGNIFGSNLVNLFFIPILDVIYRLKYGVHIFFDVHSIHLFTGLIVICLTALATSGILYRSRERKGWGWDTLSMIFVYIFGAFVLFRLR
ncbi:MAG: hypothetical protein AAB309_00010 [Deltaproteobacteria bacterium]